MEGVTPAYRSFILRRYLPDGSADNSFAVQRVAADGYALALQRDGRIVVGGGVSRNGLEDFFVARYLSNGRADRSFGRGGREITRVSSRDDQVAALALQSGGRIVAAGTSHIDPRAALSGARFTLTRYFGGPACHVPNVTGNRLTVAARVLRRAGCSLGAVRQRSSSVAPGRVLSQRPGPGL